MYKGGICDRPTKTALYLKRSSLEPNYYRVCLQKLVHVLSISRLVINLVT